ncbi:hypothetical protein Pan44_04510 [Caulifigura coniformis]|uniref:Uncharacterized protein n=1 Tax=Caulifigura coniformis TaxID=2527983 RepID=A0A517S8J9_9PLAN|nr:hypothetical protein Pan44_04510 [Caulifigura coniformis]
MLTSRQQREHASSGRRLVARLCRPVEALGDRAAWPGGCCPRLASVAPSGLEGAAEAGLECGAVQGREGWVGRVARAGAGGRLRVAFVAI